MVEPIELTFSLNTLSHPGFKVCFMEKLIRTVGLLYLKKPCGNPDFRRFPPKHNWWVDISLSQNNHYELWRTLSTKSS